MDGVAAAMRQASGRIARATALIAAALALGAPPAAAVTPVAAQAPAAPAAPVAAEGVDYPTFARLVRERGVRSVGEALALLPAEMRLNYTLVHHSRSIQQGSLESPRVLLFGTDARLVVAFNGSPAETGYDKLEILAFDEASETFEMRSIGFGETVSFSEKNPAVCTACHKTAPQPIWKDYGSANASEGHGQWLGTYGENHDLVPEPLRPALLRFWSEAPQHDRYRVLLRDPESDLFPYQPSGELHRWEHRFRPNNRMSRLLARLNARRIARAVHESELYRSRPNLVLSWFLGCDEWSQDPRLPAEIRRLFAERFPEPQHAALHADLRSVTPEDPFVMPFMLEKLATGLDVYQWNMSVVTPPANRYHEGLRTIDELIAGRLLERVAAQDPTLAPYYRTVSFAEAYGAPLYSVIQPGGAIWPGDVGELYDRAGRYHDLELAKQACELVVPRAHAELGIPPPAAHAATTASPPDGAGL